MRQLKPQKGKSIVIPLGGILVMIPVIILSVILIIGLVQYNPNLEQADALIEEAQLSQQQAESIDQYFLLPNGHALSVSYEHEEMMLHEIDPKTSTLIHSEKLDTDIFNRLFTSYQQDGLVLITKAAKDHRLLAYYYESGQGLVTLDIPETKVDGFLENHVLVSGNSIYITGLDDSNTHLAFMINNTTFENIPLMDDERIVDLVEVAFYKIGSFKNLQPALELTLYDRSSYIMSLSDNVDERFLVSASNSQWETEQKLWSHYYQSGDAAMRLDGEKFAQFDLLTGRYINDIETPQLIYYPELFPLGEDHTLALGRESVNETAPMIGYLYNRSGEKLQADLTPQLQEVTSQILFTKPVFSAQLVDDNLYLSSSDQASVINIKEQKINYVTDFTFQQTFSNVAYEKEKQAEQLINEGSTFSLDKVVAYVKDDEAVQVMGIFMMMWIAVPLAIILIITHLMKRKSRKIQKIYDSGGVVVQATILQLRQTGLFINEQPQVLMRVQFVHLNKKMEQEIKKVVNLISPPKLGDTIELLYDPRNEKVYVID
ncbi:hypothetical protein [Alkalicoccobacillus murimartini]|uniref:DUF5050 domain-containing protein n=1 Tax=Alkalicoccobacillus murimartini TaxID=171685 RepID=A0ABT9YD90_9BACI|nr:hypothetical protein [Alkalicoccobacillus murimartini]MDQ0205689.1 hypothetical protein [Alkalicoccobacillus murimartini]